jgi:hypothetical protein
MVEEKSNLEVERMLPSQNACLLATSTVMCWCLASMKMLHPTWKWMIVVFPALVVVLQHRSVWIQLAMMLFIMLFSNNQFRRWTFSFAAVSAFAAVTIILLAPTGKVASSLTQSAETTSGTHSTANWREEGWKQLLSPVYVGGPGDYAIGKPFGSGFVRYFNHERLEVEPHNCYVYAILRSGVIGCFFFIALMLAAFVQLWKRGLLGKGFAVTQVGLVSYPSPKHDCISASAEAQEGPPPEVAIARRPNCASLREPAPFLLGRRASFNLARANLLQPLFCLKLVLMSKKWCTMLASVVRSMKCLSPSFFVAGPQIRLIGACWPKKCGL